MKGHVSGALSLFCGEGLRGYLSIIKHGVEVKEVSVAVTISTKSSWYLPFQFHSLIHEPSSSYSSTMLPSTITRLSHVKDLFKLCMFQLRARHVDSVRESTETVTEYRRG